MTSASFVSRVISAAELSDICQPQQGDCESVAVALHRVFEADGFVAVYEPGERQRATHATAAIDGMLFDGDGEVSRDGLLDRLGAFRPRDVNGVESQDELMDWFEQECVVELPPDDAMLAASPDVVEACVRQLEDAQDELNGG